MFGSTNKLLNSQTGQSGEMSMDSPAGSRTPVDLDLDHELRDEGIIMPERTTSPLRPQALNAGSGPSTADTGGKTRSRSMDGYSVPASASSLTAASSGMGSPTAARRYNSPKSTGRFSMKTATRIRSYNAQLDSLNSSVENQLDSLYAESGDMSKMDAGSVGRDEAFIQRTLARLLDAQAKRPSTKSSAAPDKAPSETVFSVMDGARRVSKYSSLHEFLGADFNSLLQRFFWIDVTAPTQYEMSVLEEVFGIHPLTSEDVLTEYTREKVEVYDNYLFLIIQTFAASVGEDINNASNICVALFHDFAITFHGKPRLQCVANIVDEMLLPATPLRPDWVLMLVVDDVADELEPVVEACEREVDAIDEVIFYLSHKDRTEILYRMANARKRLGHLIRSLKPKREVLLYLTGGSRGLHAHIHKSTYLYLRDVLDLVQELMAKLDSSREVINSTQSNYLNQLNVELMLASVDSNRALNKLTVVSTLFLPLNLVAGCFGMNVKVPWVGDEVDTLWPFFGIITFMVVASVIFISLCYRWRLF